MLRSLFPKGSNAPLELAAIKIKHATICRVFFRFEKARGMMADT